MNPQPTDRAFERPDLPERFTTKFIICPSTGCWEWKAAMHHKGYGLFWWQGKTVWAHRFAGSNEFCRSSQSRGRWQSGEWRRGHLSCLGCPRFYKSG
jgi:hypothetical protein